MKLIKITIYIIITLLIIYLYLIYFNNKKLKTGTETQNQNTVSEIDKNIFPVDKNKINNLSSSTNKNDKHEDEINNIDQKNIVELESIKNKNIKDLLNNLEITKDEELLKEALNISKSIDNEFALASWNNFLSKNSKELLYISNKSTNKIEDTKYIVTIFEWYIDLSGEFESLNQSKKQEILNQLEQLQYNINN